jgi:hypothetical protein
MRRSSGDSVGSSRADGRSPYVPRFESDAERAKFREALLEDLAEHVKANPAKGER